MEKNLFQEAIADAKTVRDVAIANAKSSLAEAFTPKIKSMFQAKLQETEELDENEFELEEYGDEHPVSTEDALSDDENLDLTDETSVEDDIDLDELLAEMDQEDALAEASIDEEEDVNLDEVLFEEEDLEEAKSEDKEEDGKKEDKPKAKDSKPAAKTEKKEELVKDLSVADLVKLMKDAISSELKDSDDETDVDMDDEMSMDDEMEIGAAPKAKVNQNGFEEVPAMSETNLQEAVKAIKILKKELNETNLLNAKLLYVNKIFKAKALTEGQKVKVINAFDKATSVKEVKVVYNTITESIKTKPSSIKESLGFASKPTGAKKLIKENNTIIPSAAIYRMQQIAGIKPLY